MPLVPISFPEQSNSPDDKSAGTARLVNCYLESLGKEGKVPFSLRVTKGLEVFADTGADLPFRGALALDYALYCVIGYHLYKVAPGGSYSTIGTIAGTGHVYMARNQHNPPQIAIVTDSGQDYVLEGDVLTRNPDADLVSPNSVTTLNGYLVYSHRDGRITSTALNNANDVNALDFDTAEFHPDKLLRIIARGSELLAFGQKSIEIWQPAGGEGLPFIRTDIIPKGCTSGATVQVIDGAALWIAEDKTVRMARGYEPAKISNQAVQRSIAAVSNPEEVKGFSWVSEGRNYYAVTHTAFTWVFDLETGLWHERKSHNRLAWRCNHAFEFQGRQMFGDAVTGQIYEQTEAKTEAGEAHNMSVTFPIHATPYRLQLNNLHIDATAGISPVGDEKFIKVRSSKDNGNSWSSSRSVSLGKEGEYSKRIKLNRFGTSGEDGFLIEITANDRALKTLNSIHANIDKIEV